uniref:Centrosomal protein of 78 kDa n=2 Tax=Clastoptera arizonana TaxID=38151 RepID=A0A1B6DH92_9HEMI
MTSLIKERKQSSHSFVSFYSDLCQMKSIAPLPTIKKTLQKKALDIVGDRIKLNDWQPILKALGRDRSLHYIAIRSKQIKHRVLENIDSEEKARQNEKFPVLFTKYLLKCLTESIFLCLINSCALTCLQLERIPLDSKMISILADGVHQSYSLQHLSLNRCRIGDEGCEILCRVIRNQWNLVSLDFSGCELTAIGADHIANMIKVLRLNRYGESWKQSLRYRIVDPKIMPGLRRISLNNNPSIKDQGLFRILEELVEDIWIKALDLQNCGITSMGGFHALELVKENKYITILDIRGNDAVVPTTISEIMKILAENIGADIPEFNWMKEVSCRSTIVPSDLTQRFSRTTINSTKTINGRPATANFEMYSTRTNNGRPTTVNSENHMQNSCFRQSKSISLKRTQVVKSSTSSCGLKEKDIEVIKLREQLKEANKKLKEFQQKFENTCDYLCTEKPSEMKMSNEDDMRMFQTNKDLKSIEYQSQMSEINEIYNSNRMLNSADKHSIEKFESTEDGLEMCTDLSEINSKSGSYHDRSSSISSSESLLNLPLDASFCDPTLSISPKSKAQSIFQNLLSTYRSKSSLLLNQNL